MDQRVIQVTGLLDFSDEKVLNKLKITAKQLRAPDEYRLGHLLGDVAIKNDFNGVIFPSTYDKGVNNIVLFR